MRIGTRGSALALAQARLVAAAVTDAEIVPITTGGDSGAGAQDKSRWVRELDRALLEGRIDIAVHSAKDVPGERPDGLTLLGAPAPAGREDVLCGARALEELEDGARVGTASLRREAQLRAARADLEVVAIAGNVDTRLRRLERGELDALVLARAGLQRLRVQPALATVLDPARFVPAPGQGILALEARTDDAHASDAVAVLLDGRASACLRAERALARGLRADCHTPLGACAAAGGDGRMRMRAWVGLPDGSAWIADELCGAVADAEGLGAEMARRLALVGAAELLERAREMTRVASA